MSSFKNKRRVEAGQASSFWLFVTYFFTLVAIAKACTFVHADQSVRADQAVHADQTVHA